MFRNTSYHLGWLCAASLLIPLIFLNIQCRRHDSPAEWALKQQIDSLNSLYSKEQSITPESIGLAARLATLSDSLGYSKGIVEASLLMYQVYFKESMYPKALEMLNKATESLEDADNPLLAGRVYFYSGQFQEQINNDELALNYYLKSADRFSGISDKGRLAKVYRQIGNVSFDNEDWSLSYKYRWLAYRTHLEARDSLEVIKDLSNLSIYYNRQGKRDSAEMFLNQALLINEKLNNPRDQAQFLINVASFAVEDERYDDAENLLDQSIEILDSTENRKDFLYIAPFVYVNLGLIQQKKGQFRQAKDLFERSLALSGPSVNLPARAGINYELYKINAQLENFADASAYLERYRILMDSNNREINKQNLLALEMKYNYEQQELERLEKEKKMKLILTATGIVVGLIILVLLLLYSRQRIKVKNARLERKIQDISLERLNRELASQALNMVRINERKVSLIQTLKQNLPGIKKENQQILQQVIAGFENDQNEAAWKEFELRFKEVHREFYDKLMVINPNLTLNEKRLCAFLRLDMTSKEISAITGQSIRAIEQARIRLRKQLGLTNQQVSLSSFLSSL
jgi:tetratricopeptide (TPR) repeat protein